MKYRVTMFKNLKVCLKELEPFIRNGEHLQTGKPFKNFGELRSREILANWLLCVVLNFENKTADATFSTDPLGGDGIIYDNLRNKSYPTEHILVPRVNKNGDNMESMILKAIKKKQRKGGAAYASGKSLIVFLNVDGGKWYPNSISRKLPKDLDFKTTCIVGLECVKNKKYIYNVTCLIGKNCPIWKINIEKDFSNFKIERIQ